MSRVLVVEDDANLREVLADNLGTEGYEVGQAKNCAEARAAFAQPWTVVVLDLMLPDGDGYGLCRELRAAKNPARVLMLTARTLEEDLVRGFEAGADDYLAKPYRLRELLARVSALARRGGEVSRTHAVGAYAVDEDARTVTGPKGLVELTKTELDVLLVLVRAKGVVRSRDEILDAVWGSGVMVDPHTVDNFVGSLKKKLPAGGFTIATVRGVGFRLDLGR